MTNQANTIWIKGFSADGFQVSLTLEITDATQINSVLEQVRAQGIQPTPPPAKPTTERMTITCLTRRLWTGKDGKEKHALDFFSDPLKWRVFTVYMDSMEDIEAFEAGSGLQIGSLPVLPIGAAPERNQADKNQIACTFDVLYHVERDADGKRRDTFVGYANSSGKPAPVTPSKVTPMPADQKDNPSSANHTRRNHWSRSYEEAKMFNKRCADYGYTMAEVLQWLEDKPLAQFRDITISKYEALKRLKDHAQKPAQATSTAVMIEEVIEERSKAPADNPLAGGIIPDGFKTQDQVSDVPF